MQGKHDVWARIANNRVFGQLFRIPRQLWKERRGNVAMLVGLSMPAIVGASGITMDVAAWYHVKKETQVAADAAAYAAALNLAEQGLDGTAIQGPMDVEAAGAAGRNGFTGSLTINFPPQSGVAINNTRAVEAILTEPAPLFFTSIFWNGAPNIQARAVAMAVVSDACVWALHPTERAAFNVGGGAQIDLDCGVVVNSNHDQAALNQGGTSCLTTTSIAVSGEYTGGCVTPEPERFLANFGDPLDGLAFQTSSEECFNTAKLNYTGGFAELNPARFCGDISISGATVVFNEGNYYLDNANLQITGGSTVTSNGGVTFYLIGRSQVDIASDANVTLEAPTDTNILFYQDPNAPSNVKNKFTGGATQQLTGIIYSPNNSIEFAGGDTLQPSNVAIVANLVNFVGNTSINGNYAKSLLPEKTFARLVE